MMPSLMQAWEHRLPLPFSGLHSDAQGPEYGTHTLPDEERPNNL